MGRTVKENWALFVGMLLLMMANGLLVTLLSVRGSALGMSPSSIGLMQAAYPLGALAGCTYAPRLIKTIGHVRAFATLASLCSISAIIHLITTDVGSWAAMRLLAGFCFPGLYVIAESWLNAGVENRSRAAVLSIYFVIQMGGTSLGQALAGLDDPSGTILFSVTSILISLSFLPLLMSRNPAPEYVVPEHMSVMRLIGISPMGVIGAMLNGTAQAAFYIGVPLYGIARGMSGAQAALLLVAGTVAGAAAQFPAGWISDRLDRRLVVGTLSAIGAGTAGLLAAGLFGDADFAAIALIGATTLPVYSICVAHTNDQLMPAQIVPASGTLVLNLNLGILVGAFVGPSSIGLAGPAGLPIILALVAATTAGIAFARRRRTARPLEAGSAQPIAVQGAQTAGTLHPEAIEVSPKR